MQIENHKEEVPFAYYGEKFRLLDPAEVTGRVTDVQWDGNPFSLVGNGLCAVPSPKAVNNWKYRLPGNRMCANITLKKWNVLCLEEMI